MFSYFLLYATKEDSVSKITRSPLKSISTLHMDASLARLLKTSRLQSSVRAGIGEGIGEGSIETARHVPLFTSTTCYTSGTVGGVPNDDH